MFRVNWLHYFYFQLPKQDPENPSPTCSAFKASKQAVKIKRRRVSKGKGEWSSSRDKFKIMQNPRCKKASLCWLNLQHTCHTTGMIPVPPSYFALQKASLRCFNLPKVQREFCQRATNQQKENWGIFQVFPLRISIWSNVRTATVYWKCIGGNGEESIWRFRKKWKITKYLLFFFVSQFFS